MLQIGESAVSHLLDDILMTMRRQEQRWTYFFTVRRCTAVRKVSDVFICSRTDTYVGFRMDESLHSVHFAHSVDLVI